MKLSKHYVESGLTIPGRLVTYESVLKEKLAEIVTDQNIANEIFVDLTTYKMPVSDVMEYLSLRVGSHAAEKIIDVLAPHIENVC